MNVVDLIKDRNLEICLKCNQPVINGVCCTKGCIYCGVE